MRLPQDIANLLAVAIRDVLWYRENVRSFLEECSVPKAIMIEVRRLQLEEMPTIKVVHYVLSELAGRGEEGSKIARVILTKMYYWQDIHSVSADRKDRAIASLKALQVAYQKFTAQQAYQQEQERNMQEER